MIRRSTRVKRSSSLMATKFLERIDQGAIIDRRKHYSSGGAHRYVKAPDFLLKIQRPRPTATDNAEGKS